MIEYIQVSFKYSFHEVFIYRCFSNPSLPKSKMYRSRVDQEYYHNIHHFTHFNVEITGTWVERER